jgi:2-phospho-L-lactate transferase/gluconeogenesis factor (CofD/UPF0052 family)
MTSKRLSSLASLAWPLALVLVGVELITAAAGALMLATIPGALGDLLFYLTLGFLPAPLRVLLLALGGLAMLGYGVWLLGGLIVIPRGDGADGKELVLGYTRSDQRPRIVVLSGGAGMFIMASLVQQVERLTCVTPIHEPVEYYYRASSLFSAGHVDYTAPTPAAAQVFATLDDGTRVDMRRIRRVVEDPSLAQRHIADMELSWADGGSHEVSRVVLEAIREADAIVLGPGSLFETIVPNLLIDELRDAIRAARARTIYICNLMTEPGLTTGFSVGDHVRAIKRFGKFTPDYVLISAQRTDPDVRQRYEAANYAPVQLDLEAYEETAVVAADQVRQKQLVVEGATAIEADLSSALVQYSASIDDPGERRAVRMLRHDPDKLAAAIMALLRRE